MRNVYFLICIILSAGAIGFFSPFFDIDFSRSSAGSTSYAVEIAKFKYPVYTDYFQELDDVLELKGKDGEYHYLSGVTSSKEQAQKRTNEIRNLGYSNARLVDLKKEFPADQLALVPVPAQQDQKKKKSTQAAETAIGKLTDIGTTYFYSILLQESNTILNAESFAPHKSIKALKQDGKYYYLLGRFNDVSDAQQYLKDKIATGYQTAQVVVINKGKLVALSQAGVSAGKTYAQTAANNMGRKMRGKEYFDYYYELTSLKFSPKPIYLIELGPYNDKKKADEAVQKLKDLGFAQARIKEPQKQQVTNAEKPAPSAAAHYTIQVFASKSELKTSRFDLSGINRSYDQNDGLYRYFYGDYDNYWVCRRELREVRKKGFADAFIVKL